MKQAALPPAAARLTGFCLYGSMRIALPRCGGAS
jgi:hypothetical protein